MELGETRAAIRPTPKIDHRFDGVSQAVGEEDFAREAVIVSFTRRSATPEEGALDAVALSESGEKTPP